MSRTSRYDRFMVTVEIASNAKVGRLTDAEFRCMVTGVWALAAKAPVRGCLLIGDLKAEPGDIARQARCSVAVAKRTLRKMRELGMLENDDENSCERVHDWNEYQPSPRTSSEDIQRQSLHRNAPLRKAIRDRDKDRCRYCGVPVRWNDRRGSTGGTYRYIDAAGPNLAWNIVVACRGCSTSEHDPDLLPGSTPDLLPGRSGSTPRGRNGAETGQKNQPRFCSRSMKLEVEVEEEQDLSVGGAFNENGNPRSATQRFPTDFLKRIDGGRSGS